MLNSSETLKIIKDSYSYLFIFFLLYDILTLLYAVNIECPKKFKTYFIIIRIPKKFKTLSIKVQFKE